MLKRTVYFETPAYLSCRYGQLICRSKADESERTIPIEDLGFVILDNHSITLSLRLIEELSTNNTAVVFCDKRHHPIAMSMPFAGNTTHARTVSRQISMSLPLKKRLWKQTIEAKISNQAALLEHCDKDGATALQRYAASVKSDDSDNREGAAARIYWQRLLEPGFRRQRDGDSPNGLLNYAYTILRAAVARALTGSGLYPAIGIHHCSQYNAFALADDVMEPYRPYADELVLDIVKSLPDASHGITKAQKAAVLKLLTMDVNLSSVQRPLMVALSYTTASLVRCITGEQRKIDYPLMEFNNV